MFHHIPISDQPTNHHWPRENWPFCSERLLCRPPRTTRVPSRQSEWTSATAEKATEHLGSEKKDFWNPTNSVCILADVSKTYCQLWGCCSPTKTLLESSSTATVQVVPSKPEAKDMLNFGASLALRDHVGILGRPHSQTYDDPPHILDLADGCHPICLHFPDFPTFNYTRAECKGRKATVENDQITCKEEPKYGW